MICECPSCDQSYELADEQVIGKSVILSCPPCNTSWIVGPVGKAAGNAAAHADLLHSDATDQMGAMNDVSDDDDTGAHYRSARKTTFPPAPSYSAPPPPAPMPELIMNEGSEGSPSARRILTGQAREQRDLFASRAPSDHGRQSPIPSPSFAPPPPSSASPSMFPGTGTAARGEHSLLFSVEELKKAATMRPPPPAPHAVFQNGQRVGSNDDHGVIDLKPMLSSGGAMKSRTEALYTPATEIGPLGFALSVPPQQKTPVAVFAAAAAAAVLLLAVGLGFALRGGSGDDATASNLRQPISVAAAQPIAETPSNATISPEAKLALSDHKSGSKSDSKSDTADAVSPMKAQNVSNKASASSGAKVYSAASKGWKMPGNTQKVASSGNGNFTAKSSAPPSPPKAKGGNGGGGKKGGADPCGCGGNLQCAMKCGL